MTFEEAMQYPIGDIARGFSLLKEQIEANDKRYAEAMKAHRAQLEIYKQAMGAKLQQSKQNSARTDYGTVYLSPIETVKIEDWDAFHAWVEELQEPRFLARACTPKEVLAWRDEHGTIPPGLSIGGIVNINFRKS
jgi:hypothetical protein